MAGTFTHRDWEMARHRRDDYAHAACSALLAGKQKEARENAEKFLAMCKEMDDITKALTADMP